MQSRQYLFPKRFQGRHCENRRGPGVQANDTRNRCLRTEALTPDIGAAQASLSLQSLRNYLPTWLGGTDARAQSLVPMLKALKTATESYLEAPLSAAEVVMPFPVPDSYLDDLRSAGSSLSLHLHFSAQDPAGILVIHFYDLGRKCRWHGVEVDNDLVPLILTVDYSRAALTALLVTKDCGYYSEHERVRHDTSLGADRVFGSCRSDSTREDLVRALRDLISLPVGYGNGIGLKRISNLVLMGESASDRRLHDVLKEVLAEQPGDLVTTLSDERPMVIDPLFAASRAAAQNGWWRERSRSACKRETGICF